MQLTQCYLILYKLKKYFFIFNMNINKLISTVILVAAISTIYLFGMIFYLYSNADSTTLSLLKDAFSTTSGFLSGIATLITAYVAAKLFNDWRDEKNFELENSLLNGILSDLKPIFIELHKIRSDSKNLKTINVNFIVKTSYLTRKRIDLFESVIGIYPNLKTYCGINKDQRLEKLYHDFEKHLFCIDDFYRKLFLEKYRRYYELVISTQPQSTDIQTLDYYDIYRPYTDRRKQSLLTEINEIMNIFRDNELTVILGDIQKQVTFDDFINQVIASHNEIQNYCIERLRPNI